MRDLLNAIKRMPGPEQNKKGYSLLPAGHNYDIPGDKLFSITCTNGANTLLEINCPCLMDGGKPRFAYNILKPIPLSIEKMRAINSLTLGGLIDLARHNDNLTLFYNYVLYFIKPSKDGYVMYAAKFPRAESVTEDRIYIDKKKLTPG
jgi:hypothetical protein